MVQRAILTIARRHLGTAGHRCRTECTSVHCVATRVIVAVIKFVDSRGVDVVPVERRRSVRQPQRAFYPCLDWIHSSQRRPSLYGVAQRSSDVCGTFGNVRGAPLPYRVVRISPYCASEHAGGPNDRMAVLLNTFITIITQASNERTYIIQWACLPNTPHDEVASGD